MIDSATALASRDAAAAVQRHCAALCSAADCDARLSALRALEGFARGGPSRHALIAILASGGDVRDALLRALEDPRAAVSIAVCAVLAALSGNSNSGSGLSLSISLSQRRPLAALAALEPFVVPLLRSAAARPKRNAAAGALEAIAAADALSANALTKVLRGTAPGRHAATRGTALSVLRVAIARGMGEAEGVGAALRRALCDADVGVRRNARRCYWALAAANPVAAAHLFKGLEEATRRTLERERQRDEGDGGGGAVQERDERIAPKVEVIDNDNMKGHDNVKDNDYMKDVSAAELWPLLRDGLRSASWADRLCAVQRAASLFPSLPRPAECAQLLVLRLSDPHRRVAQAAVDALPSVVRCAYAALHGALAGAVVALLVNISGGRQPLADASRARLNEFLDMFSPDDVMRAALCAAEDVVTPAVRARAVEYAQLVIERHPTHFAQRAAMAHAVATLVRSLKRDRRGGEVARASVCALTALHDAAGKVFVRALGRLAPEERDAAVEALASALPNIARELSQRRATQAAATAQSSVEVSRNSEKTKSEDIRMNDEMPKSEDIRGNSEMTKSEDVRRNSEMMKSASISRNNAMTKSEDIRRNNAMPKSAARQPLGYWDPLMSSRGDSSPDAIKRRCRLPDTALLLDRLAASRTAEEMCAALDICAPLLRGPGAAVAHVCRLLPQLERCAAAPDHRVRERSLTLLCAAAAAPALWAAAFAPHLRRLLALARAGLDDAFAEVRAAAAALLRAAVGLPGAAPQLAAVLAEWLRPGLRADCTRGWLALLEALPADGDAQSAADIASRAVRHAAAEVRLVAVTLCVRLWMARGAEVLPWFAALSASERKLVTIYYNKAADERGAARRDLTRDMRAAGVPDPDRL